jgi:DNA-directed RNA polymerase subunit RPC12/RpoP
MANKYYYVCKDCGEDFESPVPEVVCTECLSGNIKQGELDDN